MDNKEYSFEIFNRFGEITRARNCYLYSKKGVRLLDCYQENGRAILGWRNDSTFTQFKNTLNKGLCGSFITEKDSRLEKAVSELFCTERKVFYFSNFNDAVKAAVSFSKESVFVYKPWNSENPDWQTADCVIFAPAFPWTDSVYLLCVKASFVTDILLNVKNEIQLPFALQVGITRSIYDLIKALQEREEKDWFIYDTVLTKYFRRNKCYLYSKVPQEKYDDFVKHCMDLGILINPDFTKPSIIPFGADKGNFTNLKNKPFEF